MARASVGSETSGTQRAPGRTTPGKAAPRGLTFERRWTRPGVHPYDEIEWEIRSASIGNEKGETLFEQKEVEVPASWSQLATNVVVSKYFRGQVDTPGRERSIRQLIDRVVDTICGWAERQRYFATPDDLEAFRAELTHLLVHQKMAFNSPVWFNVGVEEHPQCSACQPYRALISTPDGMIPIGRLVQDAAIGREVYDAHGVTRVVAVKDNGFKPVWRVRLRNGTFIEATPDHVVKAVRGRRTAPEWLRVDQLEVGMRMHLYPHRAKVNAHARVTAPVLIPAGIGAPAGELSEFESVDAATAVLRAEAALAGWLQSDGFVGQYESGTNRSLTIEFQVANDDEYRWVMDNLDVALPHVHVKVRDADTKEKRVQRIRVYGEVVRDFVERWELLRRGTEIRVPSRLWTAPYDEICAYLRSLFQADGYISVRRDNGNESARIGFAVIGERWTEDVQLLLNVIGIYSRRVHKRDKREGRHDLHEVVIAVGSERARFAELVGFVGRRKQARLLESLGLRDSRTVPNVREEEIVAVEDLGIERVYDIQTESGEYLSNNVAVHNCFINSVQDTMESILTLAKTEGMLFKYGSGTGTNLSPIRSSRERLSGGGTPSGPVSFMKGYDSFASVIKSGGKTRRAAKMVILDADHPDIVEFIDSKLKEERKAHALIEAGYPADFNGEAYSSIFFQNANHSVRVTDDFMKAVVEDGEWQTRAVTTGQVIDTYRARELFRRMAETAWACGDPGIQYDTTINDWSPVSNSARQYATNPCSEFSFINDSSCNLASLNLMKFVREDGEFDVEAYRHGCRLTITAQEIIVDNASYPTPMIEENSHRFRPLGLGYANLGALLMSRGLAYDSDEGRAYAAALTSIMTAEAYRQSAVIARDHGGPFVEYEKNREPFLRVIRKHRDAAHEIPTTGVPADLIDAAHRLWDETLELGEKYGYRNAQTTLLAPTGCLVGDSLVLTDRGLVRLRGLGDPDGEKWQELDLRVATDDGPRQATRFFVNGIEPVVSVETSRGYRIQGTATHRIRVVDADGDWRWRRFADLRAGDRVPMMLGGMIGEPREVPLPPLAEAYWTSDHRTFVPRQLNADLAELVGYFMGDGSLHSRGLRLCVTAGDTDVVERLVELGRRLFGLRAATAPKQGYTEVRFDSVRLALWWEACGFAKRAPNGQHRGKGYEAHVPDAVLYTNDPAVYRAFVRGLFEADGSVNNGYVSYSTVSERFSRDVQTLLLALGFVTTRKVDEIGRGHIGQNPIHVLRLLNASSGARFLAEISLMSERKREALVRNDHPQAARYDLIPVSRETVDRLAPENDHLRKTLLLSLSRIGLVTRRSATALLERTADPDLAETLGYFYDEIASAKLGEEQLTYDISVPSNVTYVANGFVGHNTIAFMMDCDTTGIEPDIALIKYKKLVGGGFLKIVNGTVPPALEKLGYAPAQVDTIVRWVDEHETIEGAPGFRPEHLPVFDCAFKPVHGERSIHYMGHVRMMAATQPFLSGAISKTVNMPEAASPEDVEQVYLEGWRLGLKAIAIYRDGSKKSQPLSTGKKKKEGSEAKAREPEETVKEVVAAAPAPGMAVTPAPGANRHRLPAERAAITHKFEVAGHEGYITVGLYPDGQPGEIFLKMAKEGSTVSGLMDSFATAISLALQYGVPLRDLVNKFAHVRFEPSGFTGNREIPIAKSIIDYIFRWLGAKFLPREERDALGIIDRSEPETEAGPVAPAGSATAGAAGAGPPGTLRPADASAPATGATEPSATPPTTTATATPPETPKAELPVVERADGNGKGGNGRGAEASAGVALAFGTKRVAFRIQEDAPSCAECGSIMVRNGSCYKCVNCGSTSGCS